MGEDDDEDCISFSVSERRFLMQDQQEKIPNGHHNLSR